MFTFTYSKPSLADFFTPVNSIALAARQAINWRVSSSVPASKQIMTNQIFSQSNSLVSLLPTSSKHIGTWYVDISLWGDVRRLACRGSMGRLGAHRIGCGGLDPSASRCQQHSNQGVFVLMCLLCVVVRGKGNPGRIGSGEKGAIATRDRLEHIL